MPDESLYDFYQHAVLSQFGLSDISPIWNGSQQIGPDEYAHYFSIDGIDYALIFEDHDGLGRNDAYIRENVLEHHSNYTFIAPTSNASNPPTYDGFHPPAPSHYYVNVTGSFTLIKMS